MLLQFLMSSGFHILVDTLMNIMSACLTAVYTRLISKIQVSPLLVIATGHTRPESSSSASPSQMIIPIADKLSNFDSWCHAQMDQRIGDSLAAAVRQAVSQLAKCLVGDKKTDVPALFHVTLVLEKNQRLELKPTVQVWTVAYQFPKMRRCHDCNGYLGEALQINCIGFLPKLKFNKRIPFWDYSPQNGYVWCRSSSMLCTQQAKTFRQCCKALKDYLGQSPQRVNKLKAPNR